MLEAIRDGAALRRVLAARGRPGHSRRAADGGQFGCRPGDGRRALRRARRLRRRLGSAGQGLRGAPRRDLAEFADTLELFAVGRRARAAVRQPRRARPRGPASRPCTTPAWSEPTSPTSRSRSACRSLRSARRPSRGSPACSTPAWSRRTRSTSGAPARIPGTLFGGSLLALAEDPAVEAVALAVDLVHELDGDPSYPLALLDVAERTAKPLAVLSNLGSAIDTELAGQLRASGHPGAGRHAVRPAGPAASARSRPPAAAARSATAQLDAVGAAEPAASARCRRAGVAAGEQLSGAPLLELLPSTASTSPARCRSRLGRSAGRCRARSATRSC